MEMQSNILKILLRKEARALKKITLSKQPFLSMHSNASSAKVIIKSQACNCCKGCKAGKC